MRKILNNRLEIINLTTNHVKGQIGATIFRANGILYQAKDYLLKSKRRVKK